MSRQIEMVRYSGLAELDYSHRGDAGFDLPAAEDVTIPARGRALVNTGLCFTLPEGLQLEIRPRSGMALKHGITVLNTPGTVDSGYRGEVGVILFNTSDEDIHVAVGDRIAQGVLTHYVLGALLHVDTINDSTERDAGGFGSSDVATSEADVDVSPEPILERLSELGRSRDSIQRGLRSEVLKARDAGISMRQIATAAGLSTQTVHRWTHEAGH